MRIRDTTGGPFTVAFDAARFTKSVMSSIEPRSGASQNERFRTNRSPCVRCGALLDPDVRGTCTSCISRERAARRSRPAPRRVPGPELLELIRERHDRTPASCWDWGRSVTIRRVY